MAGTRSDLAPVEGDSPQPHCVPLQGADLLLQRRRLIRLYDYIAEVLGSSGPAAHYSFEHREIDEIKVPTKRRVYLIGENGSVMEEPLIVSIDLDNIEFE